MLYCPKCQATYEDGTQRFCTNEGARLLPYASSEKSGQSPKGVFSSILSKSSPKKEGSVLPQTEPVEKKSRSAAFQPPSQSKFFKAGKTAEEPAEESKPIVEEAAPEQTDEPVRRKSFETLPLARIINPSLIPEKQAESDKIISAVPGKIKAKKRSLIDFSEVKEKDILQSFEADNEDLLEVVETEDLTGSTENIDSGITDDAAFNLIEPLPAEDELELNLEKNESGFSNSGQEFNLDLELEETSGAGSAYEIDFEEPAQPVGSVEENTDIELEIDELDYISVASEPKFELELDEIEDAPISEPFSQRMELDPASRKEINIADSIPKIELDLAELEEVSIPAEPETAEKPAESAEIKEETAAEEIAAVPEIAVEQDNRIREEKAETPKDSGDKEKSKAAGAAGAAAAGTSKIKATEDTAWEKRSIDPPGEEESRWFLYPLVGIILLGLGLLGFFYLTSQDNADSNVPANIQTENSNLPVINNGNANPEIITPNENTAPAGENTGGYQPTEPNTSLIEVPPAPRTINPPPNTVYFKNEKKSQTRKLADKFLGFSIYYPKTWKVIQRDDKFLDISLTTPQGLLKQLIIEPYDSKGTFLADKALFKDLVEKSDKDLRSIFFRSYQVIFEGESTFQNGRWDVYEVSFRGVSEDKNMTTWGRRLWIPVQRPGMKSGFIITMIGTSNSKDVRSVDDLGENDDLAEILKTFEPELN